MQVENDKVVTIEYTMTDDHGNVVDSTDHGEQLSFIQGRGDLLPALEAAIAGHEMGARLSVILKPEQAFGYRHNGLINKVPRNHVSAPGGLEVGLQLRRQNGSRTMPVTVVEFDEETVTLDANNPLAGSTLTVDMVIVEVREAINQELKSGRVQKMDEIFEEERIDGVMVELKM